MAKLPEKFLFAVVVQLVESIVVLVRDFSPARDDDAIRSTLGADDVEGKAPRWRPVYLQVPVSLGVRLHNREILQDGTLCLARIRRALERASEQSAA